MLTCIALALAIQPKTFDFDHKGAPVVRVVEAMAEAFGEELKADGTMSRDYVIVAFRDATAGRARELLADALNASWIEDDGKLILHRSRAQELDDERTDLAVNTRFVRAMQESLEVPGRLVGGKATQFIKTLFETAEGGTSFAEAQALRIKLPGGRAIARLVQELDAEFLASLPLGVPVTFSMTGGFGTRRIPSSGRPILEEYVKDQNDLMDLLELRAATARQIPGMGRVSANVQDVRVTIKSYGSALEVRLSAPKLDNRGYADIARFFFPPDDLFLSEMQWPDGLDEPLDLSDIVRESFLIRRPSQNGGVSPNQPSEELLDIYLHPKEHDFLELAISEVVLQAAHDSGQSFVVVPQDWAGAGRLSQSSQVSMRTALDVVFRLFYQQKQLDGAIIVTPLQPMLARQERVGRREFANSLKAFGERKRDTLTPLADVVGSCSTMRAPDILRRLSTLSRFVPTTNRGPLELLTFYAKMNGGEQSRARTGGAIFTLRELDEVRLALIESIHGFRLGNWPGGLWMREAEGGITGLGIAEQKNLLRNLGTSGVAIRVQTVRRSSLFFRALDQGPGASPLQPTSIGRLAYLGAWAERAGVPVPDGESVYRIVEEQGVLMSVISGGSEVHLASYFVPAIYEGDEMVAFDDLPQSIRDQYKAALEAELRKLQDPPD